MQSYRNEVKMPTQTLMRTIRLYTRPDRVDVAFARWLQGTEKVTIHKVTASKLSQKGRLRLDDVVRLADAVSVFTFTDHLLVIAHYWKDVETCL